MGRAKTTKTRGSLDSMLESNPSESGRDGCLGRSDWIQSKEGEVEEWASKEGKLHG